MKVVHIPYCYFPDPVGGTEAYVRDLCAELQCHGVTNLVAAPARLSAAYEHDGVAVRRFAIADTVSDLREMYGEGDAASAREFGRVLDDERPHVVHLHAFTRGVSLRIVRESERRSIPVVFTYHTPTVSCQRGTLMRWGKEVCDGLLDAPTCAACTLEGLGLPRAASIMLGHLPAAVGDMAGSRRMRGGAWTALRMRNLVALRHAAVRALFNEVQRIVVLCEWTRRLLLRNGVPAEKMVLVRHGLGESARGGAATAKANESPPVRVAALGRLDPTKGVDIVIRAIRSAPELKVALDIYGVAQGDGAARYEQELKALAAGDGRIRFLPAVPVSSVVSTLAGYDVLAVPSRWLETGPLVVLEAFAAGIPVIGSRLGGIAEIVQEDVNGLLVEPLSVEGWCSALKSCMNRDSLQRLRAGVRMPPPAADGAKQMHTLYEGLIV